MRSDNGSNFVGVVRELRKSFKEMNHNQKSEYLHSCGADWITWINNPPTASHMGGVWERQIRSARTILNSLVKTHGKSLDDESLHTLLIEVESIVNSRPMTIETISDVNSCVPLSPSNILTMISKVILPPPGSFSAADVYCRKRWRRVQHISNEFWSRWRKEYLQTLQERNSWKKRRRNFRNGDIVIIKADTERNKWPIARVIEAYEDRHGVVRTV